MKRLFIEASEVKALVKKMVEDEGHADNLMDGFVTSGMVLTLDKTGVHVMMPHVKMDI